MQHFAWILDAALFAYLKGGGGVSSSYILPKAQASRISPMDLSGAETWIVLRSKNGDVPFACIHVSKVEQFEEGFNQGDYLLTIDQSRSFRLISALQEAGGHHSKIVSSFALGVSPIDHETASDVRDEGMGRIVVNLRTPSNAMLNRLGEPPVKGMVAQKAKRLIANVSSRFSLEDVWASKPPTRLSPFAYFAYSRVLQRQGQAEANALLAALSLQDPTATTPRVDKQSSKDGAIGRDPADAMPLVDVDLSPICIENIYARKFLARENAAIDIGKMLKNVEVAEKTHQDILRDIALYLQLLKHIPMQSESIDLSVETLAGHVIFEIKSAHIDNVLSQVAKGIFQLTCYKDALINDGRSIKTTILVIQTIGNEALQAYVTKMAAYSSIKVLFYDLGLRWPHKVRGLTEALL